MITTAFVLGGRIFLSNYGFLIIFALKYNKK